MNVEYVVLGRLKPTSRHAKKVSGSSSFRTYYKLGIRNGFLYLLDTDDSEETYPLINRSDIACIYCLVNDKLKETSPDVFFKTYKELLK